jgi:hypothetical protein
MVEVITKRLHLGKHEELVKNGSSLDWDYELFVIRQVCLSPCGNGVDDVWPCKGTGSMLHDMVSGDPFPSTTLH